MLGGTGRRGSSAAIDRSWRRRVCRYGTPTPKRRRTSRSRECTCRRMRRYRGTRRHGRAARRSPRSLARGRTRRRRAWRCSAHRATDMGRMKWRGRARAQWSGLRRRRPRRFERSAAAASLPRRPSTPRGAPRGRGGGGRRVNENTRSGRPKGPRKEWGRHGGIEDTTTTTAAKHGRSPPAAPSARTRPFAAAAAVRAAAR